MMNQISIRAYAKINLGLDVIGILPNGYHEIRSIMQTVGIYDVLSFEKAEAGIAISTECGELPVNEDNLIYKAAKKLLDEYHIKEGVKIHLEKNIPIAAGMAGGSTDAAATLKGINRLFNLDCPLDKMREIAATIGADVPYCILGGTALCEGIGERITNIEAAPQCYLLVAKPDINVSTKYVYEHLDSKPIESHPDIDGMIDAIKLGDVGKVADLLGNVLEAVTVPAYPVIDSIKNFMTDEGARGCLMSGSGPTVFGIFTDESTAKNAYERLVDKKLAKQVFITDFVEMEGFDAR